MKLSAQELRLHDARTHELDFLAAALGAFAIAAAICNGAYSNSGTQQSQSGQRRSGRWSTPETEGMDSKELAKLVDFGTVHRFDSLLGSAKREVGGGGILRPPTLRVFRTQCTPLLRQSSVL